MCTPDQARAYGTMVGVSEATLQYMLGGIGKLGGLDASKLAAKIASIDNGLARAALTLGIHAAPEALEEGLQEVLEPVFATILFGEDYDLDPEAAIYSALMGALTGGVFSAPEVYRAGQGTAENAATQIKEIIPNGIKDQTTVDVMVTSEYNNLNNINTQGEVTDGTQTGSTRGAELDGDARAGVRSDLPGYYPGDESGRTPRQGNIPNANRLGLSEQSRRTLQQRGAVPVDMGMSTDVARFSRLLEAARIADPKNGWAVTPKTVEELADCQIFVSDDGGVGFSVSPGGDIEAVFRNRDVHPAGKSMWSAIPQALAAGGIKLDCYGENLVRIYAHSGFIPVARVTFNPELANPGWTADKGTPDIYVMMATDLDANTVIQKQGTYRYWTDAELAALPLMEYDAAMTYRDRLLAQRIHEDQGSTNSADVSSVTSREHMDPSAIQAAAQRSGPMSRETLAEQIMSRALPLPQGSGDGQMERVIREGIQKGLTKLATTPEGKLALFNLALWKGDGFGKAFDEAITDWVVWSAPDSPTQGSDQLADALYTTLVDYFQNKLGKDGKTSHETTNVYALPNGGLKEDAVEKSIHDGFTVVKEYGKIEKVQQGTITMPSYEQAVTPSEKFLKYSLDHSNENASGKPEAYERGLGYTQENAEGLIEQIRAAVTSGKATLFEVEATQHGIKYKFRIPVTGPNGKTKNVIAIYQIDHGSKTPRMVTNYLEGR